MTGETRVVTINPILQDQLQTTGTLEADQFNLLDAAEWQAVDEALESSIDPKTIDWTVPASDLRTGKVLERLACIKAILPEDNIAVKKDKHNVTLENYMKLALEAAGTGGNLELFLKTLVTKISSDSCPPLLAQQALLIWAPVAEIAGWYGLKSSLEEAAFVSLYPVENQAILQAYEHLGGDDELVKLVGQYVEAIETVINDELEDGVTCTVQGRKKSTYSVWRKCEKDNRPQYLLPDFFGVRVIVVAAAEDETRAIEACYGLSTVISQYFDPELGRYKDYITRPKPNGYQSLHMTLRDINGARLEIQVRSQRMHDKAEHDPDTSHMAYEASNKITPGKYFMKNLRKPHGIYAWREEAAKTINQRRQEGYDSTASLLHGGFLAFSGRGNLYQFEHGSTALDFAFASHSTRALNTRALYVNGAQVAYDTPIRHGDVVRFVYAADTMTWNEGWLEKTVSRRAHDRIRRAMKVRDELPLIRRGIALVLERCREDPLVKDVADPLRVLSESDKESIAASYGLRNIETVLREIGNGTAGVRAGRIVRLIRIRLEEKARGSKEVDDSLSLGGTAIHELVSTEEATSKVAILDTLGCNYHIAGCCAESSESTIVAITCPARGDFAVHGSDCVNVTTTDKKVLAARWY